MHRIEPPHFFVISLMAIFVAGIGIALFMLHLREQRVLAACKDQYPSYEVRVVYRDVQPACQLRYEQRWHSVDLEVVQ